MSSYSKVLYIGVTNNLHRRVEEHNQELVDGFSKKYKTKQLVYFEEYSDVNMALAREKQIKKWRREKKINLIYTVNPNWKDLIQEFGF